MLKQVEACGICRKNISLHKTWTISFKLTGSNYYHGYFTKWLTISTATIVHSSYLISAWYEGYHKLCHPTKPLCVCIKQIKFLWQHNNVKLQALMAEVLQCMLYKYISPSLRLYYTVSTLSGMAWWKFSGTNPSSLDILGANKNFQVRVASSFNFRTL